ncbi:HigA family addiction module antitoxin [Luteimonas dalianensis]|uniref:HigA family addiction module antitoxin n=1 Tax=Luteimonas dalianensis TaxID=1148196 RepID=UPI003BF1F4B7
MCPIHPGEILREEFMAPLELSANALAISLGMPATRIHEIVNGRREITADTASWLALQNAYDLKTLPSLPEIERTVRPRAA